MKRVRENQYELIYMIRMGDQKALGYLIDDYKPIIHREVQSIMAKYRNLEVYRDDMVQELKISLERSIDHWQENRGVAAPLYFRTVLKHRIRQYIQYFFNRGRYAPHNLLTLDYVCENGVLYDSYEQQDPMNNPQFYLDFQLAKESLNRNLKKLSDNENKVLAVWMEDQSYLESSKKLGITCKQYDSRLQRVRKKVRSSVYIKPYDLI